MRRLAVLFSGSGTTLQNLIDATRDGRLPNHDIVTAVSSRKSVQGVVRCREAGVPCTVVSKLKITGTIAHSDAVFKAIEPYGVDLICMAGWMSQLILPDPWLDGRVLNVHPSLLPKFGGRGMFGRHVHQAVLASGDTETGCTVHAVNNDIDAGPILAKETVPVLPSDNPDTLAARVQAAERALYPATIARYRIP